MQTDSSLQVKATYRAIIKIALPISIAILIPQLNILTNTLFLGYYKPSTPGLTTQDLLSASGVAGIYYLAMVMTDYGLVSGILMLLSRKAGENDKQGMAKLFSNSILLCLLMSFFLLLISIYFAPFLFKATIHEKTVRDAAISFIRIRLWGLPFIVLCQLANSLFLSTSLSRLIIIGSVSQTLVNVVFDYLLIFGIGFFPELGIDGTALASVFAEIMYLVITFSIIRWHQSLRDLSIRFVVKPNWELMNSVFVKSSPLMVQFFLSIGAWEVFFIYVEHLGKTASALSQLYRSVFGLVGVAAWSLASTCNSMVSNLIGQGAYNDVIPLIRKITWISLSFAVILGLPIIFYPKFFMQLLTADQALVEAGITSLRIVVLATWMLSVSTILFNGVVGTGFTRLNMYFELTAIVLYLIYNTLVIEYWHMDLPYAWLSEFIYWFTLFVLSISFLFSKKWQTQAAMQAA